MAQDLPRVPLFSAEAAAFGLDLGQIAQAVNDLDWLWPTHGHVAQADNTVGSLAADFGQGGFQRGQVAVDVGD